MFPKLLAEFWPHIKSRNELAFHPLIHALRNNAESIRSILERYDYNREDVPFRDLLRTLVIPGVSEIVHLKRQIRREVVGIDRIWKLVKANTLSPPLMIGKYTA
jgi:hypothetical protein